MLRSMTGYGRAQFADEEGIKVTVEIKSVNHRFLEQVVKLPRKYSLLEERVKELIRAHLHRGRIDVWIGIEELSKKCGTLKVDKDLAMDYYKSLKDLAETLGIPHEITIYELSCLEGVVSLEEQEVDLEQVWQKIEGPLQEAIEQLVAMRENEGERLKEELENRAEILYGIVADIEARAPLVVEAYKNRINERISSLAEDVEIDPNRLAAEVAIYAEKSDITEEVVRFRSHLSQLEESILSNEPVGRKMDFLMQELHRETNTIGSKSPDLTISQKVVDAKSEIEKMREQVQNVE
ncbi:MAG TPA: YicC family protein [Clostridia bacterium]|jgi:uncharacterized protein (TIGR00255 family)|nr:YicC family protein [Clostridia bacterium]